MCDKTYEVICLFSTRVFLVYFFIRGSSIVFFSLCVTYVFLPYFLHVFFYQNIKLRGFVAFQLLRLCVLTYFVLIKKNVYYPFFLFMWYFFFLMVITVWLVVYDLRQQKCAWVDLLSCTPNMRFCCYCPVDKIAKKESEGVRFLLIRHSKYSALPQTAFSAILPTGWKPVKSNVRLWDCSKICLHIFIFIRTLNFWETLKCS